ncbi:MAG: alanine--glyoxylate aminotransferase family protein [Aigarchaeota archaeon]|nr:alanine--glyoxylate aminotransferase family protein [Candidatus Pelearchaeum maunauluense]
MAEEWRYFMDRRILMIPGPTELHPDVQRVLCSPPHAHYGGEWKSIYDETIELSRKIFNTEKSDVIIVPGPGTLALELGIASVVEPGDTVICVSSGFFGDRFGEVARYCGANVITIKSDIGSVVSPDELENTLENHKEVKAVLLVHNETSTATLSPVEEYVRIARRHGVLTLVDAISSYGGVNIDVDGWGIDFCVGYPNKCLAAMPGAVPVAISGEVLKAFERRREKPRSWFTNLEVWRNYISMWGDYGHPYPTTVNTYSVLALREASRAAVEEGLEKRYTRHKRVARAFRKAVRSMGLEILPKEEFASPTVTALKLPREAAGKAEELVKLMLERYRIMITGGINDSEKRVIRIGHMGVTASARYLLPTIAALAGSLRALGCTVDDGVDILARELAQS